VLIWTGVRIFQNFRFLPLGACAFVSIIVGNGHERGWELRHLAVTGYTVGSRVQGFKSSRVRGPSTRLGLAQDFRCAPACAFG